MKGKTSLIRPIELQKLFLALVLAICTSATCRAEGEKNKQELLATYVPLHLTQSYDSMMLPYSRAPLDLSESESHRVTTLRGQKLSEGQKWVRFEDEFGAYQRSDSMVVNSLQTAKYQLDKTVFAVDVFVDQIEKAVQLDYDVGRGTMLVGDKASSRHPTRIYADPFQDAWENARLKSDVDLNVFQGRAWVGLRLIIPIGN